MKTLMIVLLSFWLMLVSVAQRDTATALMTVNWVVAQHEGDIRQLQHDSPTKHFPAPNQNGIEPGLIRTF